MAREGLHVDLRGLDSLLRLLQAQRERAGEAHHCELGHLGGRKEREGLPRHVLLRLLLLLEALSAQLDLLELRLVVVICI